MLIRRRTSLQVKVYGVARLLCSDRLGHGRFAVKPLFQAPPQPAGAPAPAGWGPCTGEPLRRLPRFAFGDHGSRPVGSAVLGPFAVSPGNPAMSGTLSFVPENVPKEQAP